MNQKIYILIGFVLYSVAPAYSESLLQAVQFPKVFDDVPFQEKYDVLAEDYGAFDTVYDSKTGKCISGCPYVGITLADDIEQTNLATETAIQGLIQHYNWTIDPETGELISPDDSGNVSAHNETDSPKPSINTGTDCLNNECISIGHEIPSGNPLGKWAQITSPFGPRTDPITKDKTEQHKGIDLNASDGSNVYSTANGVVEYAGFDRRGGGNYISIRHANGYVTKYLHLSEILVNRGDRVTGGCLIGKSGHSGGRSTGAHLDYRILHNNQAINPRSFLKCVK